jgi:molecular chaperone GrpE
MPDEKHEKKAKSAGSRPEPHQPQAGADAEPAKSVDAEAVQEPVEVEELRKRGRERDEFLDMLRRVQAEFSNYRKRVERERAEWTDRAVGEFVLKLLPVLDDFDRALVHADESPDFDGLVGGIRLIESKIYEIMKASGVEPFVPGAQLFNPEEHEAVLVERSGKLPDGTVNKVLRKGYRMRDRLLRPAQVQVVRESSGGSTGEKPGAAERAASEEDAAKEDDESDADV